MGTRPRGDGRLQVDGRDVAALEVAGTRASNRRGLLGRDGIDGALWLAPTKQVHTFRMRFPIDVAFVAKDGRVLATRTMPPGRLSPIVWRARGVLEAEAGRFERWHLGPDSVVDLEG